MLVVRLFGTFLCCRLCRTCMPVGAKIDPATRLPQGRHRALRTELGCGCGRAGIGRYALLRSSQQARCGMEIASGALDIPAREFGTILLSCPRLMALAALPDRVGGERTDCLLSFPQQTRKWILLLGTLSCRGKSATHGGRSSTTTTVPKLASNDMSRKMAACGPIVAPVLGAATVGMATNAGGFRVHAGRRFCCRIISDGPDKKGLKVRCAWAMVTGWLAACTCKLNVDLREGAAGDGCCTDR